MATRQDTRPGPGPLPDDFWTQNAPTPTPTPTPTSGGSTSTRPGGGNLRDPAYVDQLIHYWSNQPGANPSLRNDPNYWRQKILSGELGSDEQYIVGKFNTPEGAPAGGGAGGGGGGGGGGTPMPPDLLTKTFTTPPDPYANTPWSGGAPPNPQWAGGNFVEPTAQDLQRSPGYQARIQLADQGLERSAAARGSVLSGGFQQELGKFNQDYASNEYGAFRGNAYQDYMTKYGQFRDAATMGEQAYQNRYKSYLDENNRTLQNYLTNTGTQRNFQTDYWSRLNDLYQTGAQAGNNSYKPGLGYGGSV